MKGRPALLALLAAAACGGNPPSVSVVGAAEIGLVVPSPLIVGRDGGWGARVFGKMVFVYGDTFVTRADANGSSFHSNSFSITDDTSAADGITGLNDRVDTLGSPLPLITPTVDEAAFIADHQGNPCKVQPCGARWATWPGALVFDPTGNRAIVSYALIYAEPGSFNFHSVGQSLAVWSDFNQQATRLTPAACPGHSTLLFCQDEATWGSALVVDGGALDAFGCQKDGAAWHCGLARAPLDRITDRSAWEAWDGGAWRSSLAAARTLFDGASILRVLFNAHANAWMAVYSRTLSNEVAYRTAPALTGPWSDEATLFVANHKASDGGWTYDALVQPDYAEDGGRIIYVTHSRPNGSLFGSEMALVKVDFR